MSKTRRVVGFLAVAAACAGLSLWDARAQVPLPAKKAPAKGPEEVKSAEGVSLPVDREAKRLIQAAKDYIVKKEWRVATEQLQALLDAKEDTFFEAEGADGPKAARKLVSVRKEASRLVGELPPEGLEFYQVQYGPAADAKLQEALEKHDAALLADVSLKYLNTKAGAEATNLLGGYHLDQGNYLMAALCYERLLARSDSDKLTPKALFKAALAYRRAGDVENADKVWKRLADKVGTTALAFGPKKFTVEQLRKELDRPVPLLALAGFSDWPVFRGAPARTAQGVGGTAFLEPRWQMPMRVDDSSPTVGKEDADASNWVDLTVKAAIDELKDKPRLPAYFPVAANGKLIYRTYDGVYALHLKDGETADGRFRAGDNAWVSGTAASLHGLARYPGKRSELKRWLEEYSAHKYAGVLFENSVVGTLSHDNQRVYFVDDLAVPPYPGRTNVNGVIWGNAALPNYGELDSAVKSSRLCAVDLEGGNLLWALGDPLTAVADDAPAANRDAKDGIASAAHLLNTYFLGPPLPLGGKLYVLVEKNAEFRLLCLDPAKPDPKGLPELVWQQSLGTPNQRLAQDSVRRMHAVHLSYADGILVVPTHSGVVVGIDLLSHSLVWKFSYLETPPQSDELPVQRFPGRGRVNFAAINVSLSADRWKTSAPAMVGDKVVFTAHDAQNLHCLNLRDGAPLWKVKRADDDLYMAGVFGDKVLVVGKVYIKALAIDSGKEIWKLETGGPPAGQGAASEDVYYLPLQSTGDANQPGPGILAVNVNTGKKVSVAARRNQEMPGNLLFVEGDIVSQTTMSISAYPQEALKRAEITRRLKDNPRDPIGLAERGELFLYVGKMPEAIADLRAALEYKPPAETRAKARGKLYEAFAELFQNDFPAAEQYVGEFKALCQAEIPADADAVQKAKLADEYNRRQDNYLSLVGRGRERQGRVLDALAAFEELGTRDDPSKLVTVIDEPNSSARRDVLARGRIKALFDRSTPEQRTKLEERLAERFRTLAGGDVAAVRKFVGVVGAYNRAGREAQLFLAERLLAAGGKDDITEAETRLQGLCYAAEVRRQEPAVAARALEAMARVYVKRELFEDAVGLYKQLGTEFGSVPLRDGRTGADILAELYTDKRFLPYLEAAGLNWRGAFRATETRVPSSPSGLSLTLEPEGATLPFYQRHRLVLDLSGGTNTKLVLRDRASNEVKATWEGLAAAPYFQLGNARAANLRFAYARGHVLVLQLSNMVYAFDLAEGGGRELWQYNLLGGRQVSGGQGLGNIQIDDDGLYLLMQNNTKERVGQVAVFEPGLVCLQTDKGLVALDPRKPGPVKLWQRADVSSKAHVFGDDEYLFAVDSGGDAAPAGVRAFAAADGSPVKVPDFGGLYAASKRLRVMGRHLLVQEDQPRGGKTLRLYDIPTGRDIWKQSFAAGAIFAKSEDPSLAALVEPDRTVTVLDVHDGQVLFKSHLEDEHADKLREVSLVSDRERIYLALQRTPEPGLNWSPLVSLGIRTVRTHGALYALSRATGKIEWVCPELDHQVMILEQVKDLPILLFAAHSSKVSENVGLERNQSRVTAVDKRTGKLIFDGPLQQTYSFHSLRADPARGSIELARQDLKITFQAQPAAESRPAGP